METIKFENVDNQAWLQGIMDAYNNHGDKVNGNMITIDFGNGIKPELLYPIHLTTLACLIQHLFDKGWSVYGAMTNTNAHNFIFNDLKMNEYWSGGKNHIDADTSDSIFNLWRIIESEKEVYAKNVEMYFKNNLFNKKDLSSLNICLTEAYYNVYDHAKTRNAFSLIKFDDKANVLYAAICDFGVGIVNAVRDFKKEISNDQEAMLEAIKANFTTESTSRNKGFGLDNILTNCDNARIFSGNALLLKSQDNGHSVFHTDFYFHGTLIYFDVNINNLEDEEVLENFEW